MKKANRPYTRIPKRQTRKEPTKATAKARHRHVPKARGGVYKLLEAVYATHDLEDALTRSVVSGKGEASFIGMPLQDIIYSSTPSLKSMAYKYGFSIGKNVHSMSGSDNALLQVLESAGLGKVIYYPFEDRVVITSAQSRERGGTFKENVHVCDSGIIAGYLSAATGSEIRVKETHCVYNGSNFCQFVATPYEQGSEEERRHDLDSVVDALSQSLQGEEHGMREDFYMLTAVPLMKEPVLNEASKLLYIAGNRMAESADASKGTEAIINMARRVGVKHATIRTDKKGTPRSINLEYGQNTSTKPFVELSTSLLAGFTNSLYNSHAEMTRKLGKRSNYIVNLNLRNQ